MLAYGFSTLLLLGVTIAVKSTTLQQVKYGAFTHTATYSIANELGFFEAYGLNVTFLQIPNSTYGYEEVLNGGYDILTGAVDDAVELYFNGHKNLAILGQLDAGPDIVLGSVPGIKSVAQLRGKVLMVDSATSGFAYALRKLLSLYGLALETDYHFQIVGSTITRYQYLVNGSLPNGTAVYATLLTYPFTAEIAALPVAQRPNILARLSDFVEPYASSAFTVNGGNLQNSSKVELYQQFLGAMHAANRFLGKHKHDNCSGAAVKAQLNVSSAVAAAEVVAVTDPLTGETARGMLGNFTVDRIGLLNVIDLRSQFGGFVNATGLDFANSITPGPGKFIDYTVLDAALALRKDFSPDCKKIGV